MLYRKLYQEQYPHCLLQFRSLFVSNNVGYTLFNVSENAVNNDWGLNMLDNEEDPLLAVSANALELILV